MKRKIHRSKGDPTMEMFLVRCAKFQDSLTRTTAMVRPETLNLKEAYEEKDTRFQYYRSGDGRWYVRGCNAKK